MDILEIKGILKDMPPAWSDIEKRKVEIKYKNSEGNVESRLGYVGLLSCSGHIHRHRVYSPFLEVWMRVEEGFQGGGRDAFDITLAEVISLTPLFPR